LIGNSKSKKQSKFDKSFVGVSYLFYENHRGAIQAIDLDKNY